MRRGQNDFHQLSIRDDFERGFLGRASRVDDLTRVDEVEVVGAFVGVGWK